MKKAALWMQSILPKHYTCRPLKDGLYCESKQGFDDEEQWNYIVQAIKQKFGERFKGIGNHVFHNNKRNFYIFIKPEEKPKTYVAPIKFIPDKVLCKKCNSTIFLVDWKRTRKKYMSSRELIFIKGINDKTQFHFNTYFKCAECGWKLPFPIKHIPEPTTTIKLIINPKSY